MTRPEDKSDVEKLIEFAEHARDLDLVSVVTDPKHLSDASEKLTNERVEKLEAQERERFQRAISDGYDRWVSQLQHPAYVCRRCGALVSERETHQRWHDGQDEVGRKADSAYWRDEPIG